ncbi:PIG-L family deacetylase [Streptomyces sp. CA-294286]|uniref:PIG-L family deacetylase n=1 Tax=Streptomyces sp. CA-294286 TaxID=3240070 RepID=UPI003D8F92D0
MPGTREPGRTAPGLHRRTLLAAAGATAGALALSSCTVPPPRRRDPVANPGPGRPISSAERSLLLQVLAHPDDDLYFMNPDSRRLLEAGTPVVSVYVTAGEANGVNHPPGRPRPKPDKTAYASSRQQGLRQAYATLLGLPKFSPWRRSVLTLRGDKHAELNTLSHGDRRVDLVFLNVSVNASRNRPAMTALWEDRGMTQRTLVPDNSPLERSSSYDYEQLVDALAGLYDRYRPTVVQTLDPDPDIQHSPERFRRKDSEQRGYSDHPDHTAVACFSWAALIRWVAETAEQDKPLPRFAATAFRGYYNHHWPKNLPESVLREKAGTLVPYGGDVDWQCGNPAGCGDYGVGKWRPLENWKGWVNSTNYRYPGPQLVTHQQGGALMAYGVLGLRLVRWRAAGNGTWSAPEDLGGGPLAPVLGQAVLREHDGGKDSGQLLFALRYAALGGHGSANTREVVQYDGRAWTGLGSPEKLPDRSRRLGVPVAVTAGDGRVHLFVRNASKSVSTRVREADGQWGPWRTLDGPDADSPSPYEQVPLKRGTLSPVDGNGPGNGDGVQDGLSAVVDAQGLVHLFAAARTSVRHWAQTAPGAPVSLRPASRLPAPGDIPRALAYEDGTLGVLYRRPVSARLTAVRPDGTALPGGPTLPGYGPVAALSDPAGPVLLGRTEQGALQLRSAKGTLSKRPGACVGAPALLRTTAGAPAVVGLGADAAPWLWRP